MMDFQQSVMQNADEVYQQMMNGTTQAPFSRSTDITSSAVFEQNRDRYLRRLTAEKDAFNSALKRIQKNQKNRLKEEARQIEERLKRKEKRRERFILVVKAILCCFLVITSIAINLGVIDNVLNEYGWYRSWGAVWLPWLVTAATLIIMGIIARFLEPDTLRGIVIVGMFLTALAILILFGIRNDDGFFTGLFFGVIQEIIPVGIGGFIGLMIWALRDE